MQSPLGIIVGVRRSSLFTIALHEPVGSSSAYNLRRSRSAVQLHVGNRPTSKGVTETIRRFMALALKANHSRAMGRIRLRRWGEHSPPFQAQPGKSDVRLPKDEFTSVRFGARLPEHRPLRHRFMRLRGRRSGNLPAIGTFSFAAHTPRSSRWNSSRAMIWVEPSSSISASRRRYRH